MRYEVALLTPMSGCRVLSMGAIYIANCRLGQTNTKNLPTQRHRMKDRVRKASPALRARDHRTHRDDQDVDQPMIDLAGTPGILER